MRLMADVYFLLPVLTKYTDKKAKLPKFPFKIIKSLSPRDAKFVKVACSLEAG